MSPDKRLCLVDAHGTLHRAFHALPPLTNSAGEPVGALFGFLRVLLKVVRQHKVDHLAVCFDSPGPTFRHKAYADYKAHRKEIDPALQRQLPVARDLVSAWGVVEVARPGYEADDLIAALAAAGRAQGWKVLVVSTDKDILQLVDDRVTVYNESKDLLYTPEEVQKKYGLSPAQLVDFFALTGDASDNVPGVPGVGEKTATQLLQKHGSLQGVYAHLAEIPGRLGEKLAAHRDLAELSRRLVVLDAEAPLPVGPADCSVPSAVPEKFLGLLQKYEFNSLLPEFQKIGGAPVSSVDPAPPPPSDRKVVVVTSEADWAALRSEFKKAKEVAVDVETTGLDPFASELVGVALSFAPGRAYYLPVAHGTPGDRNVEPALLKEVLGPPLADPELAKVGHNLKFDLQVLARAGLPLRGIGFDTLVASYCLNPSRVSHGLKALALDVLGEVMTPIEDLIGSGAKAITMDRVPLAQAAPYAGADAEVSLRLKNHWGPELQAKKLDALFHDVEMPLVPILAAMEDVGIGLDVPYLRGLSDDFEKELAGRTAEIRSLAGEDLNVNSPKQVGTVLFEKLKLPGARRTKTGYSTDEDTLRKLASQHPLPEKILAYRELAKLKSTYIDGLLSRVRPTGRVHTRFNQAVAATGRLSSSDPNLQNIPIRTEEGRRIRRAFVPAPGCVFLSADYSQIDLRVLAHVSGDPALTQAFRRGEDIHAATARDIFGLAPGASVTEDQRRVAKSVNFGIVYGQTGFGLAQQLGIPVGEAQSYINAYFKKYAGVRAWIDRVLEEARREGRVTTVLHRVRYLPDIRASNAALRGFAERTAMNTPIQGTSADIIKVAMREVARLIEKKKWATRLLLQVHDDLLFEVPKDELNVVAGPLRRAMETALGLDVPVVVDLKTGFNWAALKKWEPHA